MGGYSGSGDFHLWPAMPNWHFIPCARSLEEKQPMLSRPAPPLRFEVTSDNICTVCFGNPINVCLQPCGHVAVCNACANRLQPPSCPICRTPITSICGSDGNPFATSLVVPRHGAQFPLMDVA